MLDNKQIIRFKLLVSAILSKNSHRYRKYENKSKVVVCLAADYGNLGDVAITIAQIDFLKRLLPTYEIIEYPISITFKEIKALSECIDNNDVITLIGGGNTSEQYDDIEYCREFLIKRFKRNRIISFPQSNEIPQAGNRFTRALIHSYMKCSNLLYFARDKYSLQFMKDILPELNCELAPDIVFSNMYPPRMGSGSYILLLLRHDSEKSMSASFESELIETAKRISSIRISDTVLPIEYQKSDLHGAMDSLIDEIRESSLVITDRLHGMILSYVNHTPCLVYGNQNMKIQGAYEMIMKSQMVSLFTESSDIANDISMMNGRIGINKPLNFDYMKMKILQMVEQNET